MVGNAAMSAAAICTFHSVVKLPVRFCTATVTGANVGLLSTTRPMMKSFQMEVNCHSSTTAKASAAMGSKM